jgi:radical SAM superfamily enzyme YgiQ (UPF0313 family)
MNKIKKIIFVETKSPGFHVFSRSPIPRLGTILLSTILRDNGYDASTYVEAIKEIDMEDLLSADAIGISCLTSTVPRGYEIAKLAKKAGIPVFMGGPHVTYMADEALEYCDYVLKGEADETILSFLQALEKGEGMEDVRGISFKKDGKTIHNKTPSFCQDLDTLPIPDFSLLHGFEGKKLKDLTITPIMTSRGCPYDCSFCSVTLMFGKNYRFRSKDNVLKELKRYVDEGSNWIFFYDDNFTADKKRSKELMQMMIDQKVTPKWTAQVRVEVAKDPELMDLMKRSGCHTVYIGFESINPATLKAFKKKQSVDDIEWCINTLHKNGIRVHGMFIFGADNDTVSTIRETVHFAKKNRIDSIQFLMLTPLPGTALYFDFVKNNRIVNYDWSLYDAHHALFQPKRMSFYELQTETMKATRDFYSFWEIAKRAVRLDVFSVIIKAYGWRLTKTWFEGSDSFVEYTKALTNAGKAIEIAAKKTAEDLKDKYKQLELAGSIKQRPPHQKVSQ